MAQTAELETLLSRLQELLSRYRGRVEYGNLRSHVSECDVHGCPITNVALVYETPGGSTDQINVEHHPEEGVFVLIDAQDGEVRISSVDEVLALMAPRIAGIPEKRLDTLKAEIRRQVDAGSNHSGLVGHLNRMMQSGLIGGTITHLEMRDAISYAVQYMKSRNTACG
jgi:hypothetical protein